MNCDDIAWILDERRITALSPFEKADFDAHVARCADCAAQRAASESLESFRAEVPPLVLGFRRERHPELGKDFHWRQAQARFLWRDTDEMLWIACAYTECCRTDDLLQ